MAIVDELVAVLGYELKGEENLKKFKSGLDETEKGLEKTAIKAEAAGTRIGLGVAGGLAAVTAAGIASIKQFAEVERRWLRLQNTMGSTAQEAWGIKGLGEQIANNLGLPLAKAAEAAEALAAAGENIQGIYSKLPDVMRISHATGASPKETADTVKALADNLGITPDNSASSADLFIAGGDAGKFEAKDMARYLPSLAPRGKTFGYSGVEGQRQLQALLQTLRGSTGTAGEANTLAEGWMAIPYDPRVQRAFSKAGVDIEKEYRAGIAAGGDPNAVLRDIISRAIGGDAGKLPQFLGQEKEREAARSMLGNTGEYERFMGAMAPDAVTGRLNSHLKALDDTTAALQRLSNSLGQFGEALGATLSPLVTGVLNPLTDNMRQNRAVDAALKERGYAWWRIPFVKSNMSKDEGEYWAYSQGWRPRPGEPAPWEARRGEVEGPPVPSNLKGAQAGYAYGKPSFDPASVGADAVRGDQNTTYNTTNNTQVSAPVTVNVTQAVQAPAAVGNAISGAISSAAQSQPQPGRMQSSPAAP